MITPEDAITCKDSDQERFGFTALYDTCGENEIAAGTVLCAKSGKTLYIFQLDTMLSILYDEEVSVMTGTLEAYPGSEGFFDIVGGEEELNNTFRTSCCRFPTEVELKWYDSISTV